MHLSILSIASLISFIHTAAVSTGSDVEFSTHSPAAAATNVSTATGLQSAVNAILHQIAAAEAEVNKVLV